METRTPEAIAARRSRVAELHPRLSQLEIALELAVSPTQVSRDEKALGLIRRRGRPAGPWPEKLAKDRLVERRSEQAAVREERDRRWRHLYEQGRLSCSAIAVLEHPPVTAQTVWNHLVDLGVSMRPPGRSPGTAGSKTARLELVAAMEAAEASEADMAKAAGVSVGRISADRRELGLRRRVSYPHRLLSADELAARDQKAEELYRADEKRTLEDVAGELGTSSTTVLRTLERCKVPRRPAAHEWWLTTEGRGKALRAVGRALEARNGKRASGFYFRHAAKFAAAKGNKVGRRVRLDPDLEAEIRERAGRGQKQRTIAHHMQAQGVTHKQVRRVLRKG